MKPAEIVGIPGIEGWSLIDRRMWNLLLANAWDNRLEDPTADFTIDLRELRGLHRSNERIKAALEKLQKTLVVARMPDGKTRTVQMLGATDLEESDRTPGVLTYDFHRKIVPLLRRSEIYTRMEIKVLSAFTSRYGLSLYEVLSSKINLRKTSEEVDMETLRQWLGVQPGRLLQWSNFRRKALEIAVREVNALSPFDVTIQPVTVGRKVTGVIFTWAKKEPFSPAEELAALEVNRHSTGRPTRVADAVASRPTPSTGTGVRRDPWGLTEEGYTKGLAAAAEICALDADDAYAAWRGQMDGLPEKPKNVIGHWITFCRQRARRARP